MCGCPGREWIRFAAVICAAVMTLLAAGCKSTPEGLLTPRPGMAYLDFYAEEEAGTLSWDILKFDPATKHYRILYSEIEPAPSKVVRVQIPPGEHRVCVAFLNRAIKVPATLDVSAEAGMVIPIKVVLTEGKTGTYQQREQTYGPTARGHYGRISVNRTVEGRVFEITAKSARPVAFAPRDQMPYAKPEPQ